MQNKKYNLVTHHALFTPEDVKQQMSAMTDPYDQQNPDWSEWFLLSRLEPKFQWQLATSTMNRPVLWKLMALESLVDSVWALIMLVQYLQTMSLKFCTKEKM